VSLPAKFLMSEFDRFTDALARLSHPICQNPNNS